MSPTTAAVAGIDMGPETDRDAEAILGWPDEFIGSLKDRLLAIRAGTGLPANDVGELEARGLLDPSSGHPTAPWASD